MKKIGVIGCGGMIGPIICNYLLQIIGPIIPPQPITPIFFIKFSLLLGKYFHNYIY